MVHHAVESVVETSLFVDNVNWLDAAIHLVLVKRLKDQKTNTAITALITLPSCLQFTLTPGSSNLTTDVRIIWDNLEVFVGSSWFRSVVLGSSKGQKNVVWSCTREFSTVFDNGPLVGWVIKECHRSLINILKLAILEVMRREFV